MSKCNHCHVHDAVGLSEYGYPLCQGCMNHHQSDIAAKERTVKKSALESQVGGDWYSKMAIQPAKYTTLNGIGHLAGDAIAYISRYRAKNGREDLEKAIHSIQLLIELEYGGG